MLYRYSLTAGFEDSTTNPLAEILKGDTLGFNMAHEIGEPIKNRKRISGKEINGINQSASIVDANPKRKRRNLSFFSWFPIMRMDVFIAIQLIKIGVKIVPSDLGQYTFHHQH